MPIAKLRKLERWSVLGGSPATDPRNRKLAKFRK